MHVQEKSAADGSVRTGFVAEESGGSRAEENGPGVEESAAAGCVMAKPVQRLLNVIAKTPVKQIC